MKIAITGHRPDDFYISHFSPDTIQRIIEDTVVIFKREFGEDLLFNIGGAVGTDQWTGRACIENNVKFHLYLPFSPATQTKFWKDEQKIELNEQIQRAQGVDIIDPSGNYDVLKYQERNVRMIDSSNILVAFWVGKKRGGTFNAIKYALSQSKFVFNALDELRPIFKETLKTGFVRKND